MALGAGAGILVALAGAFGAGHHGSNRYAHSDTNRNSRAGVPKSANDVVTCHFIATCHLGETDTSDPPLPLLSSKHA